MSDSYNGLEDSSLGRFVDAVRRRYVARLGTALLGAVVLLVVLGLAVQAQTATEVRADAERTLETSATVQAENVDEWIGSNERQVRTISRLPAMQSDQYDELSVELATLVEQEQVPEEVVAIHVIDKNEGEIVSSSRPEMFVGQSPSEMDEPFVPKVREGFSGPDEVYVSEPFALAIVDHPVVAILSPVPFNDRVVVFMINPSGKTQDLRQPIEGGHTHVVTADGEAVAQPGSTTHEGRAKDRAIENALNGDTGVVFREDGSLMGYAAVGAHDWVVLTHVNRADAFAMIGTVRNGIIGMVLAALLALGLVGATVGRSTATALRSLSVDARDLGTGDLAVEFDVDRPDELGLLADSLAEMRDSLREQIGAAEEAREEAELRRQRTQQLNDHLEKKAAEYGATLAQVADGDLTQRVEPSEESEAMASVGTSINRAVAGLSETLAEVRAFADLVAERSHTVDTGSEDVSRASEEASEAVQEISDGAARQTEMLDDVAAEMEALSASAQQAASATDDLSATSERAAEAGEQGREAARAAIQEMNEVEAQTEEAVRRIETLDDEMTVIGEVVELITDIAEQTNILALNASIEAARAGEAGEGFAVVADEVKDLAEETREAAADIGQRLERVEARTDATVADIQETRERLTIGVDTVERAIEALEEIANHVEEADAGVKEISTATAEQARAAQSVVSMVDDLTSISSQTTTEAQTVASAAEEQTATLTEVSDSASELSTRAEELQSLLDDFEIAEPATADEAASVAHPGED